MQTTSSRIWTRVAASISNGDIHYTTSTSNDRYISIFATLIYKYQYEDRIERLHNIEENIVECGQR